MDGIVKKSLFPGSSDGGARRGAKSESQKKLRWKTMREMEKAPGEYSLIKAMYVCAAPKGRVFAPFWSENGYRLSLFWSERVLVFEGTTGEYERIHRFNSK